MVYTYDRVSRADTQAPPIVSELEALFEELPDDELLKKLRTPKPLGGRPGYDQRILWRCFVAFYYLGLPSVSDLIRCLHDNPWIAQACGINSPNEIPSQPTFSRFGTKLARSDFILAVKNVHRGLTRRLYEALPGLGESVAIDSTDIKAWSNGGKLRSKGSSDPDAGWVVKTNTEGNKKYVWGYKVHILCGTTWELPLVVDISKGNLHDVNKATPLLQQARYTYGKFHPKYVICDSGYSSDKLRYAIKNHYKSTPIIDPNPGHKKAFAKTIKTAEWKLIYNRRTAVERLNGRLKSHRRLNSVRVRGKAKVRIHAMLSVIAVQAQALATRQTALVRKVA